MYRCESNTIKTDLFHEKLSSCVGVVLLQFEKKIIEICFQGNSSFPAGTFKQFQIAEIASRQEILFMNSYLKKIRPELKHQAWGWGEGGNPHFIRAGIGLILFYCHYTFQKSLISVTVQFLNRVDVSRTFWIKQN